MFCEVFLKAGAGPTLELQARTIVAAWAGTQRAAVQLAVDGKPVDRGAELATPKGVVTMAWRQG